LVAAFNGPLYEGIFTNICSLYVTACNLVNIHRHIGDVFCPLLDEGSTLVTERADFATTTKKVGKGKR
jgi:hypothetical protein